MAPPTGEPILVGVLHSQTGTMRESETPVLEMTLLALEELNQRGGLLGRPVKAVVRDGASEEALFASEAERLIKQDRVCVLFGCWTLASRKAVKEVVEAEDHLLIYPLQYEGLEESPNIVYTGAAPISNCYRPSIGASRKATRSFTWSGPITSFRGPPTPFLATRLPRAGAPSSGRITCCWARPMSTTWSPELPTPGPTWS